MGSRALEQGDGAEPSSSAPARPPRCLPGPVGLAAPPPCCAAAGDRAPARGPILAARRPGPVRPGRAPRAAHVTSTPCAGRGPGWARCAAGRHGLTHPRSRGRGGAFFVRSRSPSLSSAGTPWVSLRRHRAAPRPGPVTPARGPILAAPRPGPVRPGRALRAAHVTSTPCAGRGPGWARCAAGRHGLTRSRPRGTGRSLLRPLPMLSPSPAGPRGSRRAAIAPRRSGVLPPSAIAPLRGRTGSRGGWRRRGHTVARGAVIPYCVGVFSCTYGTTMGWPSRSGPAGRPVSACAPRRGRGTCPRLAARASPLRAPGLCARAGLSEPLT